MAQDEIHNDLTEIKTNLETIKDILITPKRESKPLNRLFLEAMPTLIGVALGGFMTVTSQLMIENRKLSNEYELKWEESYSHFAGALNKLYYIQHDIIYTREMIEYYYIKTTEAFKDSTLSLNEYMLEKLGEKEKQVSTNVSMIKVEVSNYFYQLSLYDNIEDYENKLNAILKFEYTPFFNEYLQNRSDTLKHLSHENVEQIISKSLNDSIYTRSKTLLNLIKKIHRKSSVNIKENS